MFLLLPTHVHQTIFGTISLKENIQDYEIYWYLFEGLSPGLPIIMMKIQKKNNYYDFDLDYRQIEVFL